MPRRPKYQEGDFPPPGTVFIAPTKDGRLSSGRVLRRQFEGGAQAALIAASPWLGSEIPRLDLPDLRKTLVLTHHSHEGHQEVFWVFDLMPPDFTVIGQIELPPEDRAASSHSFTGWQGVPIQALLQWRWDHDRDALLREEALDEAREAETHLETAKRRSAYLLTLTLDSLASRKWFDSWDADQSSLYSKDSRSAISRLIDELRGAPRITKGLAKRLLKQSVEAFNQLDTAHRFIATFEREDICEAYEQIMSAAGFPELADEVDKWRDW